MFRNLFGKKSHPAPSKTMVVVELNAKLQPIHRGEFFEDPLLAALERANLGEVTGGGTLQSESGEIIRCDIEVQLASGDEKTLAYLIETLEGLGAPRGSKLTVVDSGAERQFGQSEGLAVYLNGTDLPDQVYKECDSNHVLSELGRLLEGEGRVLSYWEGRTETSLYMYGRSFAVMRERLAPFLETYPLCRGCRVVQIA